MSHARALMREVSDALAVYGADVARARTQHAAYAEALRAAGLTPIVLPAAPDLADGCFIEDAAVVEGARALLTRMGFPQRRAESEGVRRALFDLGFEVIEMDAPATLDGGDVLRAGGRTFVGQSSRTNAAGAAALDAFLGTACVRVPVTRCLHLKTAVTECAPGVLALNPEWVDPAPFAGFEIRTAPSPNTLLVNGRPVTGLDISEFERADGGLTCLSILLA